MFNMVLKLRLMTTYTKHNNENDIDNDYDDIDNDVDILNSASRILQC